MARSTSRESLGHGASAPDGRARILEAAEELMATRGAYAVSLREINDAAGQRNASSIQYHFGGREGLLRAIVERHMTVVDARRNEMVDALEADGRSADVRGLVRALVQPLAERLASPSGRNYLRILLQLAGHTGEDGEELDFAGANRSLVRVGLHLARHSPELPPRVATERRAQVAAFVLQALADQARRVESHRGRAPLGVELFTANLVDVLVAVVSVPVSAETRRLSRR